MTMLDRLAFDGDSRRRLSTGLVVSPALVVSAGLDGNGGGRGHRRGWRVLPGWRPPAPGLALRSRWTASSFSGMLQV